ncbi:hypothetical protein F5Y11DRAFT_330081 [Daldinia sp. FL1419]|nr:hypothetical protein F5Y11DRAFT_330081 [Daldinia sp. FL1419]
MKTWTSALSAAALLLPFAAADCDKFEFKGKYGGDGFTTTSNQSMPISGFVNCTEEIAHASNSGGSRNGTCDFHHYSMGLVVHPEIRFIHFDDEETREHIFELVRESMNPTASILTDFNATIVMNYTAINNGIKLGDAGYYAFTPFIRCFDGVLSDCDDDDDDPEDVNAGKLIRACGLAYMNDKQAQLEPGRQQYSGHEGLVQVDDPDNIRDEPQPTYNSVADQATVNKDKDNASTRSVVNSATLLVALVCSVYNFI